MRKPKLIPDRDRYACAAKRVERAAATLRNALRLLTPGTYQLEWSGRVREALDAAEHAATGLSGTATRLGAPTQPRP